VLFARCDFAHTGSVPRARACAQICGLEAHETSDNDEAYAILKAHLRALRGQRCLQRGGTRFRIILEANLGDFAQQVGKRAVANISDAEVVCTHQHCYGVFTGPTSKPRYVFKLREKLRERALVYHSRLVTVNPYADPDLPRAELAAQTRRQFEQQLGAFRTVFNVPKALLSTVRVTYSGKADRDNQRTARTQDDLVMALLFGYYYAALLVADAGGVFTRSRRNALATEQPAFMFH